MGYAYEVLLGMKRRAAAGEVSFAEILGEKHEFDFAEFFVGYKQVLTVEEMLNEVGREQTGGAPCMNHMGEELQKYIIELYRLPKRPKNL